MGEQNAGLIEPKDFHSNEGVSLTGSIISRKQVKSKASKIFEINTDEIF